MKSILILSMLVLVVIALPVAAAVIFAVCCSRKKRYKVFVEKHSISLRELQNINQKYAFRAIPSYGQTHIYDNKNFYDDISPRDYLIYHLRFWYKDVVSAIANARENKKRYALYKEEVRLVWKPGRYDVEIHPKKGTKFLKIEKRLLDRELLRPQCFFQICITLKLSNIRGSVYSQKADRFDEETIEDLLARLAKKDGDRYEDRGVWDAICRVERGKVNNKLRFAIYQRDGHRCVQCGRTTDLEIDHKFPISKGGLSTWDNLQTLCHRCNARKSNYVAPATVSTQARKTGKAYFCAQCGAPMILRKGKYGQFYGCSNFPNCKYIQKLN